MRTLIALIVMLSFGLGAGVAEARHHRSHHKRSHHGRKHHSKKHHRSASRHSAEF
jgi:hypothetical protein